MSLIFFLIVCLLSGFVGSRYTFLSVKTWYPTLRKPTWTPPDKLFAPVWTVIYILMAVSAWLVWENAPGASARGPMLIFSLQLLLNVLWSVIFFGMRNIRLAFKEICLLWLMIVMTIVTFSTVSMLAGLLLLPYLLWVSFAAYLNFSIQQMNQY